MNIPERAVEAAARVNEPAFWDYLDDIGEADEAVGRMRENSLRWARRLVEAAAPFIAAQAWDEAYVLGVNDERTSQDNSGIAGCFCSTPSACQCFIAPARVNPYRNQGEQ